MIYILAAIEWLKVRFAAILGAAAAILAAVAFIKRSGRQDAKVEQLEQVLENVRKKDETVKKIERLPDGDAARRLRDQWSRD
jgi:hypothetical protein